jgi:hypothetical protein
LIETIPESCMVPLYVYGGRSEILRAYTVTRYCYGEKLAHFPLLVEIPYGKGRIFASTFKFPKDKRTRFSRLENHRRAAAPENPRLGISRRTRPHRGNRRTDEQGG